MKGDKGGCSSEWHGFEGHGLTNVRYCDIVNKICTYIMKRLVIEERKATRTKEC